MAERMSIPSMNTKFAKSIHEDDLAQLNEVLHQLCSSNTIHSFGIYKKRDDHEQLQEITIILRRKTQGKIIVCVYQRQQIGKFYRFVKTNCKETGVKVVLEQLAKNEYDINMELPYRKDSIAHIDAIRAHSFTEGEDIEYRFSTEDIITRYIISKESDRRSASSGSSGSPGKKSKKRSPSPGGKARSKQGGWRRL
jgi:hypothetical protein